VKLTCMWDLNENNSKADRCNIYAAWYVLYICGKAHIGEVALCGAHRIIFQQYWDKQVIGCHSCAGNAIELMETKASKVLPGQAK